MFNITAFLPFVNKNIAFLPILSDNKNMNTLSEKIEACYKAIGKDRTHFAQEIGIPESTIRNWSRYNSIPASDLLYKIARYFNLPMEYFMDGSENPLSDKEIATIIKLRQLNEEQLKMVMFVIDKFSDENKKSPEH